MKSLGLNRYALAIGAAAALLTGCGGSQPPIGLFGAMTQSRGTAAHADRSGSWMLPEAQSEALLYVSNVHDVTVYSYPKGKLVGTLKGFYESAGECVDRAGNIFIANLNEFLEYKHGGKKPIKTLTLSGYAAVDCSVDPMTGDLATTWNKSATSANYLAVYKNASGTPTQYTEKGAFLFYCGYDDKGNLYADGQVGYQSSAAIFVELPQGGNQLRNISLTQSFVHVGALQWDGRYLAMGDDVAGIVYRLAVSGSSATVKGSLSLDGPKYVYQWWIDGKRIIGASASHSASYWKYPAGGSPYKTITRGIQAPYGATVSKLPK